MASDGDPSQIVPEPVPESTVARVGYVVRETMQPAQKSGKTPMVETSSVLPPDSTTLDYDGMNAVDGIVETAWNGDAPKA